MTAARVFNLLVIIVFIFAGVHTSRTLIRAVEPRSSFDAVHGKLIDIVKHDSGGDAVQPSQLVELRFSYEANGDVLTSATFSPLCTYCRPATVDRFTSKSSSQIQIGMDVVVYVKRSDPAIAYLQLPSTADLLVQAGICAFCLLFAPAFIFWYSQVTLKAGMAGNAV